MKKLADEIARSEWVDDYLLWRMSKNMTYQIHEMIRNRKPVPIEIIRLRAAAFRARDLRRTPSPKRR